MSIDKKGFKYRLSNVLAWFGFIYTAILWSSAALRAMGFKDQARAIQEVYPDDLLYFVAFGLYPCCALVNYLMTGSFRLLPWRKFDE